MGGDDEETMEAVTEPLSVRSAAQDNISQAPLAPIRKLQVKADAAHIANTYIFQTANDAAV